VQTSLSGIQRLSVRGRRPALPAGVRVYAFGDVHGRLDLLDELLSRAARDISVRPVKRPLFVFLGDYIDRGPSSREAIDRLIAHGQDSECIFLKGNHEQVAIKCLSDRSLFDQWMRFGGVDTLEARAVRLPLVDEVDPKICGALLRPRIPAMTPRLMVCAVSQRCRSCSYRPLKDPFYRPGPG
jgi:Calcineurin-like phosphoesterase